MLPRRLMGRQNQIFWADDLTAARRMFVATKPHSIDEYLAGVSPENRAALQKVRRAVHAAAPGADECISYGMPAFRLNGKLIAGFKSRGKPLFFSPDERRYGRNTQGRSHGIRYEPRHHSIPGSCWPAGHTRSQAGQRENCGGMNC